MSANLDSGAYFLLIYLDSDQSIKIGALGEFDFPAGYYVYVGSAMKNLHKRVARHLSSEKTIRWHIDYLLSAPNAKIIYHRLIPSHTKDECQVNATIAKLAGAQYPIPKFGSSDCRKCTAHLTYFEENPEEKLQSSFDPGFMSFFNNPTAKTLD